MPSAERRPAPDFESLTKAQRKILTHLARAARRSGGTCALSTRQMVREPGLVRRTVKTAIHRLNDLGLLATRVKSAPDTNEHRVLVEGVPGLSVPKTPTAGDAR